MSHSPFSGVAVLFAAVGSSAYSQDTPCDPFVDLGLAWCEDFESYPLGPLNDDAVFPPGFGWEHAGVVTDAMNHTAGGAQSLTVPPGTSTDALRLFHGYDLERFDQYELLAYFYIPSTSSGDTYFIVYPSFDGGGQDTTWAVQLHFDADSGLLRNDLGNGGNLPLVTDRWASVRCQVRLADDAVVLSYDDVFLDSYSWTEESGGPSAIAAVDLFTPNGAEFYVDDLSLVGGAPGPRIVHQSGPVPFTTPCSGYVDPRRESTNGLSHNLGLNGVRIQFDQPVFARDGGPIGPASFLVTSFGAPAPTVASVTDVSAGLGFRFELLLSDLFPLRTWTTIRADVQNADGNPIVNLGDLGPGVNEPDRLDYAAHPANVDQNELVSPLDLLRLRQFLTGTCPPPHSGVCPSCGGDALFYDINRDNFTPDALDLLRLRQLLVGVAPATTCWPCSPNNVLPPRP